MLRQLVIASYNIHKCVGIDKQFSPSRIIEVIKELKADILALQETDQRFGQKIGLLDLEKLRQETDFCYIPIKTLSKAGHGWHGNALFIRDFIHEDPSPSLIITNILQTNLPGVEPRGAICLELEINNAPLRIIATHFGLLRHSRQLQSRKILDIFTKRPIMPTILLGDFNEWRPGRRSSLRILQNYFDTQNAVPPSFPSRYPLFALDRILAYPCGLISDIEIHNSALARIASDHLPIKAVLHLDKIMHFAKEAQLDPSAGQKIQLEPAAQQETRRGDAGCDQMGGGRLPTSATKAPRGLRRMLGRRQ